MDKDSNMLLNVPGSLIRRDRKTCNSITMGFMETRLCIGSLVQLCSKLLCQQSITSRCVWQLTGAGLLLYQPCSSRKLL
jgi:hypothetical protein